MTLTTMEQKLNDLNKIMMNTIDEKFMAASFLLPSAIHDESGCDITAEGADIL